MFTHCSDVLIVDFQQVNGSWLGDLQTNYLTSDASRVQLWEVDKLFQQENAWARSTIKRLAVWNMFATNNIGVFRALSNFYDGAFLPKYFR